MYIIVTIEEKKYICRQKNVVKESTTLTQSQEPKTTKKNIMFNVKVKKKNNKK